MSEERVRQQKRAELLNEASGLLYKAHHNLKWNNFLTPNINDLAKVKEQLELVVVNIDRVIADKVFNEHTIVPQPK